MMRWLLCAVALCLLLGCDSDDDDDDDDSECVRQCETVNSCPDASFDPANCGAICVETQRVNRAGGCNGLFSEMTRCVEGLDDACDMAQSAQCNEQSAAWLDCIIAYCEANPDDDAC